MSKFKQIREAAKYNPYAIGMAVAKKKAGLGSGPAHGFGPRIKARSGVIEPDEGTVLFNGKPIHEMNKKEWDSFRSRISYMFQNNALFDSFLGR